MVAPVFDAAGELRYFVASQLDVTIERHRLQQLQQDRDSLNAELEKREALLAEREARLAMALNAGGLGTWTLRTKLQNYYLVLGVGTLCWLVVASLVGSRFGRAMRGLKENESLALSVGINATRTLTVAAVISAAMAGAAGSLYAHYLRIIDPDVFLFSTTVSMVIMVVAGGKGTLMGPVIGGLIFGLLPVALRPVMAPEAQWIVYGLVLIVILFVMPRGIVPGLAALLARRSARAVPVLEASPEVQR